MIEQGGKPAASILERWRGWLKSLFLRSGNGGPASGIGAAGYGLSALLLVVLVGIRIADPGLVQSMRMQVFDLYQRIQPRDSKDRFVVTVDIDEKSLAEIGQWPWPRDVLADLVRRLTKMGAVVIAFDILFPEPDRMSPPHLADRIPGLGAAARAALREQPSNEALFAGAMRNSRVVLAQSSQSQAAAEPAQKVRSPFAIARIGGDPKRFLLKYKGIVRSLPELERAAKGLGNISIGAELDGVIRRVPLVVDVAGRIVPALALEMLRVATGQSVIAVKSDAAGVSAVVVGGVSIATDRNGRKWVHYARPSTQSDISAADVLAGRTPKAAIKGKLVLVGTSAAGLKDLRVTPVSAGLPGFEVHAQLLDSILSGSNLVRPNYALGAELVLLVFTVLFVILLAPRIGALATLASACAVAAALVGGSWTLFDGHGTLIDVSYSLAGAFLIYAVITYVKYMREETGRKVIRSAFDHYLSPALVARLASDPDQLSLGGEVREMTIMFSDVRGFTSISERTSAEDLTRLVNLIMTRLTDAVLAREGTIDKYIGDCLMAFWNAPLTDPGHARNACLAALGMIECMGGLNQELQREAAEGSDLPANIDIGIGLNTGECLVGNMGSTHRFNYSVLGDTVNLAARLEGQTAFYGCPIILGEEVARQAQDLAVLEVDLVLVKGKERPSRIFALLGDDGLRAGAPFTALTGPHHEMLAAYRGRDWRLASEKLERCRANCGDFPLMHFYALYAERIQDFERDDPGADWDGVFVAETK